MRSRDDEQVNYATAEREAHNGVMGLFASKPEDPTEWAGLPSEPLGPLDDTEALHDPPVSDVLLGETPPGATWVTIPVMPPPAAQPSAGEAAGPA